MTDDAPLSKVLCYLLDDESATFRVRPAWTGYSFELTIRKHSTDGGRDYAVMESIPIRNIEDANFDILAHSFYRCLMTLREAKPREPFEEHV